MQDKSPYISFDPDYDDPRPCGHRRPRRDRVGIEVARKEYKGQQYAALRFGDGTRWVRKWFDGLIHPNSQATLLPFAYVADFATVLNDRDIEVVLERDVWRAFEAATR